MPDWASCRRLERLADPPAGGMFVNDMKLMWVLELRTNKRGQGGERGSQEGRNRDVGGVVENFG